MKPLVQVIVSEQKPSSNVAFGLAEIQTIYLPNTNLFPYQYGSINLAMEIVYVMTVFSVFTHVSFPKDTVQIY